MLWTIADQFESLKRGFFVEINPDEQNIYLRPYKTMDELERQVLHVNLALDGFIGDDPFAVKLADFIAKPHSERRWEKYAFHYSVIVHNYETLKAERERALYMREKRKKMSPEDRARAQTKDKLVKRLDALNARIDRADTARRRELAIHDAAWERMQALTGTLDDLEKQRANAQLKLDALETVVKA